MLAYLRGSNRERSCSTIQAQTVSSYLSTEIFEQTTVTTNRQQSLDSGNYEGYFSEDEEDHHQSFKNSAGFRSSFKKAPGSWNYDLIGERLNARRRLNFSHEHEKAKHMRIEPEKYPNACFRKVSLFANGALLHKGEPDYGYLGPEHFVSPEEVWNYFYKYTVDEPDYIYDAAEYFARVTSNTDVILAPTGYTYGSERHWPNGRVPIPHLTYFTSREQQVVFRELDKLFREKYPTVLSPFCDEYLQQVYSNPTIAPARRIVQRRPEYNFERIKRNSKSKSVKTSSWIVVLLSRVLLMMTKACYSIASASKSVVCAFFSYLMQVFCTILSSPYYLWSSLQNYYRDNLISTKTALDICKVVAFLPILLIGHLLRLGATISTHICVKSTSLIKSCVALATRTVYVSFISVSSSVTSLSSLIKCAIQRHSANSRHHIDANGNQFTKLNCYRDHSVDGVINDPTHEYTKVQEKTKSRMCLLCLLPLLIPLLFLPFIISYWPKQQLPVVYTKTSQAGVIDCQQCSKHFDVRMAQIKAEILADMRDFMDQKFVQHQRENSQVRDQLFAQVSDRLFKIEAMQNSLNSTIIAKINDKLSQARQELLHLIENLKMSSEANYKAAVEKTNIQSIQQTKAQDELKTYLVKMFTNELNSHNHELAVKIDTIVAELNLGNQQTKDDLYNEIVIKLSHDLYDKLKSDSNNLATSSHGDLNLKLKAEIEKLRTEMLSIVKNEVSGFVEKGDAKVSANVIEHIVGVVTERVVTKVNNNEATTFHNNEQLIMLVQKEIQRSIYLALAVYDADKTAKPDFALETAGGSVYSIGCTETYTSQTSYFYKLWYGDNAHRALIQPSVNGGECWSFHGSAGQILLKLAARITITGITLEHIPKSLSLNGKIDSAPKDIIISGVKDPKISRSTLLAEFRYEEDGQPLQYFSVKAGNDKFQFIEVRFLSNWGHPDYTCVYRIRVHGDV